MSDIGELQIVLRARDVSASAAFYERLGFVAVDRDRWDKSYASLQHQGVRLSLMDFIPGPLLLNVKQPTHEAVSTLAARLVEEGIEVVPAGAPHYLGRSIRDPDGNEIYISSDQPLPEDESSSEPGRVDVELVDLPLQSAVAMKRTRPSGGVTNEAAKLLPRIRQYVRDRRGEPGPAFVRYLDATGDSWTFEVGILTEDPIEPTRAIRRTQLPAGPTLTAPVAGPDVMGQRVWPSLAEAAAARGVDLHQDLRIVGGWEVFETNPLEVGLDNFRGRLFLPLGGET